MSRKKSSEVEEVASEEMEIMSDCDYFSASVKVKGKREPIKIRGRVEDFGGWPSEDVRLMNSQYGEPGDCDSQYDYPYQIQLNGRTQNHLDEVGITDFKILKDKRQMRVIDDDQLPEIVGHKVTITSDGSFSFGCGAVKLSRKEVETYVEVSEKIEKIKGYDVYDDIRQQVVDNEGIEALEDIDLNEVKELLEKTKN